MYFLHRFFENLSYTKFNENPSSRNWSFRWGRMDRETDRSQLIVAFTILRKPLLKSEKKLYNSIFESYTEEEGGERILLASIRGGATAMLWPVMFQGIVVWIYIAFRSTKDTHVQLTLRTLNYDWIKSRLAPNFLERKYSAGLQVFLIINSRTNHISVVWSNQRNDVFVGHV